jgi:undecaprenyl-phosphate galactose phosphotransferase
MVLSDLLAIAAAFGVAVVLADQLRVLFEIGQVSATAFLTERSRELLLLGPLAIGLFAFGGLYRRGSWELDEIRRIIAGVGLLALIDATLQFALRDHDSRLWFLLAYPLVALMVITLRMALRALPVMSEAITNHIVLLGSGMTPDQLVYEMRESRSGPVRLLQDLPLSAVAGRDPAALIGLIDSIAEIHEVPCHRIQVVLAPEADEMDAAQKAVGVLNAAQRPYAIVLPFAGLARNGLSLQHVVGADMVMAEMRPAGPSLAMRAVKRLFDIVVTGLGLIVLAPLLLMIAALLMLEGGPVFFSQMRVGRGGQRFACFKFRSMRPDAQERLQDLLASNPAARAEWETHQKLSDDPRITPVGHFLRQTSLDELPQLFNVLKGDMSLIGPRPIIAPEVEGYPGDKAYYENPNFMYYARCVPGISGLWQVSGRASTHHDERVRLDRWYARNWSIWLDLMILFKTVRAVLDRQGSG